MSSGKKEGVAVYIDGSNTYNKLKTLGMPEATKRFDYARFVAHLVGERHLVSQRYYIGVVRNYDGSATGESRVKKQQSFLEGLRATGFEVKLGRIMYDDPGRIREKGVDVKLSVDLVVGAADNFYDTAIVISSDTDLIPAIKYISSGKKKATEYVSFAGSPSLGMIKECNTQRLFSKEDLMPFQTDKKTP